MKKLLSILLLAAITVTVYAEKNHKGAVTKQPAKLRQQQAVKSVDTAGHMEYRQRELAPRLGRSMRVDPSAQPPNNNPYQNTTNKPIKAEDIKQDK